MRNLAWIALACLALTVYLGKSYQTSLPANDSALHATVSMAATHGGSATPLLPIGAGLSAGQGSKFFNDHPFTMFYVNGHIQRLLGPGAWSARVLPALFGVGAILMTAWLGTLLGGEALGLVAALILLFVPGFIRGGASFHLDVPMTFFILLSFGLWRKGWIFRAGVAAGIGMIVKTPVAMLILPVAFLYEAAHGRWRTGLRHALIIGLAAAIPFTLIWSLTAYFGGWSTVRDYWERQLLGTAVGGRGGAKPRDLLMFFRYIARGRDFLPWSVALIPAAIVYYRRRLWRSDAGLIPVLAAGFFVLAVSPLRFKYDYYFLPTIPFIALLLAQLALPWAERGLARLHAGIIAFALIVPAVLISSPIPFAPEAYPALRKFNAFIQSYGECTDLVLFVEGGHPYGGPVDFSTELDFYTGRKMRVASCDEASRVASDPGVAWIIVAAQNYASCLSAEVRTRFSTVLQFGNQYLLTTRIPAHGTLDLTPLERELKAVTDCTPAPLPRDRYRN